MNRTQAKEIANSGITFGQIKEMLQSAYNAGAVGNVRGVVNKSLSKGFAFNIFWKCYRHKDNDKVIEARGDSLGAANALREFGDYWEGNIPKVHRHKVTCDFNHQEAINPERPE